MKRSPMRTLAAMTTLAMAASGGIESAQVDDRTANMPGGRQTFGTSRPSYPSQAKWRRLARRRGSRR